VKKFIQTVVVLLIVAVAVVIIHHLPNFDSLMRQIHGR
jgi:hypothetical protein